MIWYIGDIQGCYDPLMRLLERIGFDETKDTIRFVGDLVNRGNRSREVLSFLYSIRDSADIVLGNHDIALIAAYWDIKKSNHSINPILQDPMVDNWIGWLLSRPFLHLDHENKIVMVHAGISPLFTLEEAAGYSDKLSRKLRSPDAPGWLASAMKSDISVIDDQSDENDKLVYALASFVRMRFCYADGILEFSHKGAPGPKRQKSGLIPWFECPMRKKIEYRIVFGHWSTLGLYENESVSAIDSGCLWRGRLSALNPTAEGRKIVQIECPEGIIPQEKG